MAVRGEDGVTGERPFGNRPRGAVGITVVLAVLGVIVFGRHTGDGFLSDDFLFLDAAGNGVGALLQYFTGGSYPKLIRPLPGLLWLLGPLPMGAAVLHVISILVHLLNARSKLAFSKLSDA